jgi:uncharacterized protein (DUF1800 family)
VLNIVRFCPERYLKNCYLPLSFALVCSVLIAHSADAAPAPPSYNKPVVVDPAGVFTWIDDTYGIVTCATIRGRYIAGTLKGSRKFLTLSQQVTALKKKVAAAFGKKKKKLARQLKTLKRSAALKQALCAQGRDPLEPVSGLLTSADVNYLYEKAALGAPPQEAFVIGTTQGAKALVDYLLTPVPDTDLETESAKYLDEAYATDSATVTSRGIQLWGLNLLTKTKNPFYERFSLLFLHNILATSNEVLSDNQRPLMIEHLNTIRAHARAGDYRTLLKAIAHDPVMLIWLNGNQNTKQQPNENFARELMELFTLSPASLEGEANYSERTVAQVARACTGWTVQQLNVGGGQTAWSAVFGEVIHDPDPNKMVFEDSPYQGLVENDYNVIDHILDYHPNAPQFLAKRIAKEYLDEDTSLTVINRIADEVRRSNYNLKTVMASLLKSKEFYKPEHRNTIIKNPTERVVEFLRRTGIPFDLVAVERGMEGSGQQIGLPPTVFGWKNNEWPTGHWLLALSNTVTGVVRNDSYFARAEIGFTYSKLLPSPTASAEEIVWHFEQLFGVSLNDTQRSSLVSYLNSRQSGTSVITDLWDPANMTKVRRKLAGLLEIFFRSTDFQMR